MHCGDYATKARAMAAGLVACFLLTLFYSGFTLTLPLNSSKNSTASTVQPTTWGSNQSSTLVTSITDDEYRCYSASPFIRRPTYADCLLVINELPNDSKQGIFHSDGMCTMSYLRFTFLRWIFFLIDETKSPNICSTFLSSPTPDTL